jgi:hypothetical protein
MQKKYNARTVEITRQAQYLQHPIMLLEFGPYGRNYMSDSVDVRSLHISVLTISERLGRCWKVWYRSYCRYCTYIGGFLCTKCVRARKRSKRIPNDQAGRRVMEDITRLLAYHIRMLTFGPLVETYVWHFLATSVASLCELRTKNSSSLLEKSTNFPLGPKVKASMVETSPLWHRY